MWLVEELAICIKPFPVNISNYKYKPMLHGDFGSVFDVWSVEESGDSVGICRIDLYREADALNTVSSGLYAMFANINFPQYYLS